MAVVSRKQFAEILDLSERMVGKLIDQGMPAERHGKRGVAVRISTKPAIDWLIEQQVNKVRGKPSASINGNLSIAEAERLAQIARARKLTAEADQLEDELCAIADVEHVFSEAAVQFRTSAESIAGRMAGKIAGMTSAADVRNAILAEARRAADSAATILEAFIETETARAAAAAAADSSSVAMGGNEADAAKRER